MLRKTLDASLESSSAALRWWGARGGESAAPKAVDDGSIALEAEGGTVDGKMVIAQDASASGGRFVWEVELPDVAGAEGGTAVLQFPIETVGTFAMWAHVTAPDAGADSFWINWEPVDPEHPFVDESRRDEFYWDLTEGPGWTWQRVTSMLGEYQPRTWTFAAPTETTLRIGSRENGAKIDAIFITAEIDADTPDGAKVRLP